MHERTQIISRLLSLGYEVYLPLDCQNELAFRDDSDLLVALILPIITFQDSPAVRCDKANPARHHCILASNSNRRVVYIVRAHQFSSVVRLSDSSHILKPSKNFLIENPLLKEQLIFEQKLRQEAEAEHNFYNSLLKKR